MHVEVIPPQSISLYFLQKDNMISIEDYSVDFFYVLLFKYLSLQASKNQTQVHYTIFHMLMLELEVKSQCIKPHSETIYTYDYTRKYNEV